MAAPLPLEEVLARVQTAAPERRAALERTVAARGSLLQAGRLPNPLFEVRAENWRLTSEGISTTDPSLDLFATVSQPIELGGKRARRQAVAAADAAAADAELRQTERQLTLDTARLYLAAVRARELGHYLSENRHELEPLLDSMQRRVARGYAAEADLMKLRAEAARVDAQRAQARLDLDRAVVTLGAALAEAGPVDAARLVEPALVPPVAGSPPELAARIVDTLPEVVASRARIERGRQTLRLERAQRLPDPLLTAGYKRTAEADTLVTGVVVPIPVFNTNAGNIQRAAAEERSAALEHQALVRRLTAELVSLVASARDLTARARRIEEELLEPAHVARTAARATFRETGTNVLQLVDAERVHADAHRDALDLKLEAYARSFEIELDLAEVSPR